MVSTIQGGRPAIAGDLLGSLLVLLCSSSCFFDTSAPGLDGSEAHAPEEGTGAPEDPGAPEGPSDGWGPADPPSEDPPEGGPSELRAAEGFVGFHGTDGYSLSWLDRSDGEDRYLLERRGLPGGAFELVAELPADAESYVDATAAPASGFVYRLVAASGDARGEPATCDSAMPLWTFIRIVDYDGLWGTDGPDLESLTLSHLTMGLEQHGSNPNLYIVLIGDGYGAEGSIYAHVRAGASDVVTLPEVNMSDPETYRDFFDWVVAEHPGQRYVVEFWGHGGGALSDGALGYDDTSGGGGLQPDEMGSLLDYLAVRSGRRIGLFYLCTCLNGMFENAYAWRRSVDYLVAGETTVGCAYQPFEALVANEQTSARELALATIDGFRSVPAELGFDVVYCAVDMSVVGDMPDALSALADALLELLRRSPGQADLLLRAAGRAQQMASSYADLHDLVSQIAASIDDVAVRAACEEVTTLLEAELVLSFVRTDEGGAYSRAHGLSIVHPTPTSSVYGPFYSGLSFACDTSWDEYVAALSR